MKKRSEARWAARGLIGVVVACSLLLFGTPVFAATVGSDTDNLQVSWGGGGTGSVDCGTNTIVNSITAYTTTYSGYPTLTYVSAGCATLSINGAVQTTGSQTLGSYGGSGASGPSTVSCGSSGSSAAITGARVYESGGGFTQGLTIYCGTLPGGTSSALSSYTLGSTTATYTDLTCTTGSVMNGLNVRYGAILDAFGLHCAAITPAPQSITLSTLGTSSKTYPYSQALSMSTTGTVGTGAITYAIASGGTATGCALSNASSTATITASTSGSCLVSASIAADSNYPAATSSALTFTFSKANQSALSITSTSGTYGVALSLSTSGGSGTGGLSFVSASGTSTCTVSGASLTASAPGTCLVTATQAADAGYNVASSPQTTITFAQGVGSETITITNPNFVYRQVKNITAVASAAGKVAFKANLKYIPGCKSMVVNSSNAYTATCPYKPSIHSYITLTVTFTPTDTGLNPAITKTQTYIVAARSGAR